MVLWKSRALTQIKFSKWIDTILNLFTRASSQRILTKLSLTHPRHTLATSEIVQPWTINKGARWEVKHPFLFSFSFSLLSILVLLVDYCIFSKLTNVSLMIKEQEQEFRWWNWKNWILEWRTSLAQGLCRAHNILSRNLAQPFPKARETSEAMTVLSKPCLRVPL